MKWNLSHFFHNSSNVSFISHDSYREIHSSKYSKCFQSLLLALRHALKWSCHWSVKLCWLLTTFQSDTASVHWRPSLVSDKHVPACWSQSVSPGSAALVSFSCSQGRKRMVHITVTSCCSNSCCQTQVCQAAGNLHHVHKSTELLWHNTLDSTPDVWPPDRFDLNPVDYTIWTVVQECIYQKFAKDIKRCWWAVAY